MKTPLNPLNIMKTPFTLQFHNSKPLDIDTLTCRERWALLHAILRHCHNPGVRLHRQAEESAGKRTLVSLVLCNAS